MLVALFFWMITLYPELAIAIIIVVCVFSLKCASLVLFWNFTIRCSACLNLVPYVIFLDVRLGIVCFRKMVVGISSTEIYLDFEDCYFTNCLWRLHLPMDSFFAHQDRSRRHRLSFTCIWKSMRRWCRFCSTRPFIDKENLLNVKM